MESTLLFDVSGRTAHTAALDLLQSSFQFKKSLKRTSLVDEWLRLHAFNAGDPALIPGQGTGSHMPQLRPGMVK